MKTHWRINQLTRLTVSLLCALFITSLCLWVTAGNGRIVLARRQFFTRRIIQKQEKLIEEQRAQTGQLPSTLARNGLVPRDNWGSRLRYVVRGAEYSITSYGADGQPGGTGLNADLSNKNLHPAAARLSFWPIVLHPEMRAMLFVSLLAGVVMFILAYSMCSDAKLSTHIEVFVLVVQLLALVIATAVFAAFTTALHVPSGH